MRKMTASQHHIMAGMLIGTGVLVNLIGLMHNSNFVNPIFLAISIILVVGGAVYSHFLVRCPHCGDKLKGCKFRFPERCPKCGKSLNKLPEDLGS